MATFSQKDITLFYVGKPGITLTTGGPSTLTEGEIGVFTPGGTRLTPGTSALKQEFVLMQGRGTKAPFVTPKLSSDIVKKAKVSVYSAASEKIDFIGFNGTSGAIETINESLYYVRLNIDLSLESNFGNTYVKHGVFKADTSATQEEVASGITKSIITNLSREAEKLMKVERVTNSTTTASTSGDITVVNGSKFIQAATDIDNGGVAIGDFIVLSGIAYKIVALNVGGAQVAELDTPYQGASGTVTDANASFITAANAASGDWGIKLTGLPLAFDLGKVQYRKSNWVTTLDGFGNTPLTVSQTAKKGNGVYEQVAEMEWFLRGNDGNFIRKGSPNTYPSIEEVIPGTNYEFLEIDFSGIDGTMTQVGFNKKLLFAIPQSTPNYYTAANGVQLTLEALLGLAGGSLAL